CQDTIAQIQYQKGVVVEHLGIGRDPCLGFRRGNQIEAFVVPALFIDGELLGPKAGNRISKKVGHLEQDGNFTRKGGEFILNGKQQFIFAEAQAIIGFLAQAQLTVPDIKTYIVVRIATGEEEETKK